MKCTRAKCTRRATRQKLCHLHYDRAPVRGYVDGQPTRDRINLLLERGVGWRGIQDATGLAVHWLVKSTGRVQARTQHLIFSIPVPAAPVSGGRVSAVGTIRRIQALSAIGWPQSYISKRLAHNDHYANQLLKRDVVYSATAEAVDRVYRELHMTPGPSVYARVIARKYGWVSGLAWDDIDDPNEVPNVGAHTRTTASERIAELYEIGVRDVYRIAERLGIQKESVERQLYPSRAAS